MKAILFAGGTHGDVHPQLGIGQALAARGHQVLFVTTANHLELFQRFDLAAISIFDDAQRQDFKRQLDGLGVLAKIGYARQWVAAWISRWCELMAEHIDDDTILVFPPVISIVARLLQEKHGTPYLTTVFTPAYLFSTENPPRHKSLRLYRKLPRGLRKGLFRALEYLVLDRVFRSVMKESIAQLGIPAPRRILSEWGYSPQQNIGLFYEWFCQPAADWPRPLAFTGFPLFSENSAQAQLSPALEDFLAAGTPPIIFTPGTMVKDCRAFFETALAALQQLGQRGIFLSQASDQMPSLPASVRHETYLPLHLLLPRASALAHHGGIGTVAQAMATGTPQLILPGHSDQFDNALLIEQLGCGLMLEKALLDKPENTHLLSDKLRQLLTAPAVKAACQSVQGRITSGSTALGHAADVIEATFRSTRKMAA
ncbi:nucleotide disphospho-sugar-binding domain-containing protein [Dyella silvatica]|uniref:nucleotide disphospho-sugar-binding domain-containing protein n=1 Tax=Dyella silvatica TaxID=2992128 RepID=UPI0022502F35|nr:nucleotide disphospho-sugar-binding domain-containing protein [Dyella silvatica]